MAKLMEGPSIASLATTTAELISAGGQTRASAEPDEEEWTPPPRPQPEPMPWHEEPTDEEDEEPADEEPEEPPQVRAIREGVDALASHAGLVTQWTVALEGYNAARLRSVIDSLTEVCRKLESKSKAKAAADRAELRRLEALPANL